MIWQIPLLLAKYLLITLFVEVGLMAVFRYKKRDLLLSFYVNVLTNPFLVSLSMFLSLYLGHQKGLAALYFLEILAVLTEGFIYNRFLEKRKINGYLLSLILNLCSYLLGLLF